MASYYIVISLFFYIFLTHFIFKGPKGSIISKYSEKHFQKYAAKREFFKRGGFGMSRGDARDERENGNHEWLRGRGQGSVAHQTRELQQQRFFIEKLCQTFWPRCSDRSTKKIEHYECGNFFRRSPHL